MRAQLVIDERDKCSPPLVERAQSGDSQALEALVRSLIPRVRNLVRYLRPRDEEIDDLSQDALVVIVRRLPSFAHEGSFESWVHGIVARVCLATFRKRDRRAAIDAKYKPRLALVHAADARTVIPSKYLERRQGVRLLDQLPDSQREAVVLHHLVGWTAAEIAEQQQVSKETIRSRLKAGRARLRALREDEEGGDA